MNDPIEERLEGLRPSEPSPTLMERLLAAQPESRIVRMPEHEAKVVRGPWLARVAWAAAAAAVAILTLVLRPTRPKPAPLTFTVESRSYLLNADDLGVVAPEPDRPYRLVRCVWLEDDKYRTADGRSSLRHANAREQIVPVALETY